MALYAFLSTWHSKKTFKEGIAADASLNTCGPNESIPDHLQCLAQVGALPTLLWQLSRSLSRRPINVPCKNWNDLRYGFWIMYKFNSNFQFRRPINFSSLGYKNLPANIIFQFNFFPLKNTQLDSTLNQKN